MPPSVQDGSIQQRWLLPTQSDDGGHGLANNSTEESLLSPTARARDLPQDDVARSKTRIAIVNFFKGLFGAGVLALPHAFSAAGVPLGTACFIVVAVICLATMLLLLDCQRIIRERQGLEVESYEELAGVVFGPWGFRVVQVVMAGLTLVFCTGFVIAISTNLASVFPAVSRTVFCLLVVAPLTALSWVEHLKDLWLTSVFGLLVYMLGVVGVTVFYSATRFQPHDDTMAVRWSGLFTFFGSAVYSLEGINLTLPVAASMKSRRRPPLVMSVGLMGFTITSLFYSSYAYAAGLGGCDIITACLEPGPLTVTVQLALSVSLLATHPVYLIVASNIFENALLGAPPTPEEEAEEPPDEPDDSSRWSHGVKARVIRSVEVALTCLVAAVVPNFTLFTSLVGSSALTFIGFIMPACMWIALLDPQEPRALKLRKYALAAVIIVIGLVAMVVGTRDSIVQIMALQ